MWTLIRNIVVGFLNNFFTNAFNTWFQAKQSEDKGAAKQALKTEHEANAKVLEAAEARDSVKPLTVDELPAHNPDNDPDFRD